MYLESYLENRNYSVQVGNYLCEYRLLRRGVPQGSVLRPILFCIYIRELSFLLQNHGVTYNLFADDAQFYLTVNDILDAENCLTSVMLDIKKWMDGKELKLNEDNTECMLVGKKDILRRSNGLDRLTINNKIVNVSNEVRDPGVIIDKHLNFETPINTVAKVVRCSLRNIAFIKKHLDAKIVILFVNNYIISRLDYCNSLY